MNYYNISLPRESAWEILNELGETDAIQFVGKLSFIFQFNLNLFRSKFSRCPFQQTILQHD
jgi:hypothetical protein